MNSFIKPNKLDIELTSRCVLECPACPRTAWKDLTKRPIPKRDQKIEDLVKFLDCPGGEAVDLLSLCGDYGDVIYYPQLIDFIKTFRKKRFRLHTNGSHQPREFWEKLCNELTEEDEFVFAIDGLEDTNHLYRKNSKWESVMQAVDIVSQSPAKMKWQTIIFNFNESRLSEIKDLANSKGADWFSIRTHRYGDDNLIPTVEVNVDKQFTYKPEYNENDSMEIVPMCDSKKTVSSDGIFYPCCWITHPSTLYTSELWKNKEQWLNRLKIKNITLDQGNEIVQEWSNHVIQRGLEGSAEVVCKMKCRKGTIHD